MRVSRIIRVNICKCKNKKINILKENKKMAFSTINGYDVEHASSLVVYENLMQEIQHINGKGCVDTYTPATQIERVNSIDVKRILPYAPRFRKLGATANGAYHNAKNVGGYGNAPQSEYYTIPVDLYYDEGVAITDVQEYSSPTELKSRVMAQIVKTAGMSINVVTYAKQIEAFFRNGDNFDKALAHQVGSIVAGDIDADEIASSVFSYDPAQQNSATSIAQAIINANASLDDGIIEIGALAVPVEERQGFISPKAKSSLFSQYLNNASNQAVAILGAGFINPFTGVEGERINSRTGFLGEYDGIPFFQFNSPMRKWVYVALGILGTADDASLETYRDLLDQFTGMIVYGAGTLRGIVGPAVEANPNAYFGGVYILPKLKMGVECIHGATVKLIVDAGTSLANAWTATNIAGLMNTLAFTPIDGVTVTGSTISGFNDGTTN